MSSVEISGKGFLFDAAGTVPFFREGDIPDEAIVDNLSQIRRTYEARGRSVSDEEWKAVINHFNLPTPSEVDPDP